MTTEWSHLPNAVHIDRILASVKAHPEQWDASGAVHNIARRGAAYNTAWDTAWDTASSAASSAAGSAAYYAAGSAAYDAAKSRAWGAVYYLVRGAILCLVSYDDSAYMIDLEPGELEILAAFGNDRALLLLPACKAFNLIKQLV